MINASFNLKPQFSLSPDPRDWGAAVALNVREPDDYLHNPDPKRDRKNDKGGTFLTARGFANLGCLAILLVVLIGLLCVRLMIKVVDNLTP